MTGSTAALTALGIPPGPAEIIGDNIIQAIAGIGTAAVGAALLSGTVNTVTTASSQTAFILKNHNTGRTTEVYNTSATAALVFPPTGGTIDGGSVDASVSISQNKGRIFRYVAPLTLRSILSA